MAVVAGGLGLPEHGAIVSQGLGASEPANPGAIAATIGAGAALAATLTATSSQSAGGGLRPARRPQRTRTPNPIPAYMAATLTAGATLTADIEFTANFDDLDIETLLLVGAL